MSETLMRQLREALHQEHRRATQHGDMGGDGCGICMLLHEAARAPASREGALEREAWTARVAMLVEAIERALEYDLTKAMRNSDIYRLRRAVARAKNQPDPTYAAPPAAPAEPPAEERSEWQQAYDLGRAQALAEVDAAAREGHGRIVGWWNGLHEEDLTDMTGPDYSPVETTNHDIPLYAGTNPCNLPEARAAEPQQPPEKISTGRGRGEP